MNEKNIKKKWSKQEVACLSLGYNLGATLKTLSIVFNRTESALNKALSRMDIRQYGTKSKVLKFRGAGAFKITPQKLRFEINKYLLQQKKQDSTCLSPSTTLSELINYNSENKICKVYNAPRSKKINSKKNSTPLWSNLDYALKILRHHGHLIHRLPKDYCNIKNPEIYFCLDGSPKTASQIFVQANKVRITLGLQPFYIETITEY